MTIDDATGSRSLDVELSVFHGDLRKRRRAAYQMRQMHLSVGCSVSRQYGSIPDGALIVGMAYCMIDGLFRKHGDPSLRVASCLRTPLTVA